MSYLYNVHQGVERSLTLAAVICYNVKKLNQQTNLQLNPLEFDFIVMGIFKHLTEVLFMHDPMPLELLLRDCPKIGERETQISFMSKIYRHQGFPDYARLVTVRLVDRGFTIKNLCRFNNGFVCEIQLPTIRYDVSLQLWTAWIVGQTITLNN